MILKEIKPGMAVHCENDDELKELLEEAKKSGYQWLSGSSIEYSKGLNWLIGRSIHFYAADECTTYRHITHSSAADTTKFSDLILPEPSAEEVLQICTEICHDRECSKCPMDGKCYRDAEADKRETVEICARWKSDHEKKTPEFETVDVCRIIEVMQDGRKRCVYEEDIKPDPELPYGSEQTAVEEILKRYCMEHEGEFIAVHEVISRVKND